MAKKEEKPKTHPAIKTFLDRRKQVGEIVRTTDFHLRGAYIEAEKTLLDKQGNLDYKRLDDKNHLDTFVDTMVDKNLLKAAKHHFHVDPKHKGDEIYNEQLLQAYVGVTKSTLKNSIKEEGSDFSYESFDKNIRKKVNDNTQNKLGTMALSHFNTEHIDDIVKHVSEGKDILDSQKLRLDEALGLLQLYHLEGGLSKRAIKSVPDYALKDKKLRSDYKKAA